MNPDSTKSSEAEGKWYLVEDGRREFLKKSLLLGGSTILAWHGIGGISPSLGYKPRSSRGSHKSRIVISKDSLVRTSAGDLDPERILGMLDRGVKDLFAAPSAAEVWSELVKPSDTVGIKVNSLAGRGMSTRPKLVEAIIRRLIEVGVKERRIIIWDRSNRDLERAGYRIKVGGDDVQCYGNDVAGYESRLTIQGSVGSLLSRILTQECSVVINVPVLKDHGICGVTVAMKNFFGAIHNPNKYHGNVGDPYIADLNLLPAIRKKTILTIVDALSAQYEGGPPYKPQWSWNFNGIILGTDQVALDYVGWEIIEEKRAKTGIKSLKEAKREPTYIATAADEEHRIGTNDPARIEIITTGG